MPRARVAAAKVSWYDRRVNFYQKLLLGAVQRMLADSQRERRQRSAADEILNAVRMRRGPSRKPPESGIVVPAIPPKGPLPKLGGAEAPLEFD